MIALIPKGYRLTDSKYSRNFVDPEMDKMYFAILQISTLVLKSRGFRFVVEMIIDSRSDAQPISSIVYQ